MFEKIICFFKGHCLELINTICNSVPYAGTSILEFVDYRAEGKCRRCGKLIHDYGRARVAYGLQPCSPVLASSPSWIVDGSNNAIALSRAIIDFLDTHGKK